MRERSKGNTTGPTDADTSVASGRTMAEIANGKGKAATPFMTAKGAAAGSVWHSNRDDSAPAAHIAPGGGRGATKTKTVANLPEFVEPQLAKLLEKPPAGPGWAHEIKFDGYRMQLRIVGGEASLRTRKGLDWSERFPEIVAAGAKLADGVIDGEVCALDASGAPDFAALQAAISEATTKNLVFFVFDQLFVGNQDLRPLPLADRKARLEPHVAGAPANIRYVDHFITAGGRRFCCRPAAWTWRVSSPNGWTRPICRAAARVGASPSAGPATRW